jgi:tRNA A37 threonylcarbamoyladenosine synthetase subunit TsaC/SUA5/YrdC
MSSSTLILPEEEGPLNDAERIRELLEKKVDLVIDGGAVGADFTTVIDLTGDVPVLLRRGKGDVAPFGIEEM